MRRRTIKTIANKVIDELVHPKGSPKTLEKVVLDEVLHAAVEGEFRLDKFMRYTVAPLLSPKKKKKRRKGRRR